MSVQNFLPIPSIAAAFHSAVFQSPRRSNCSLNDIEGAASGMSPSIAAFEVSFRSSTNA
jgi:hypothetical protein